MTKLFLLIAREATYISALTWLVVTGSERVALFVLIIDVALSGLLRDIKAYRDDLKTKKERLSQCEPKTI